MTFEEFFIKKKIDLVQLQRADRVLYDEFHAHYHQMGEKSFDHTKKYWFNRLRKDYLLQVEEIPGTPPKPEAEKSSLPPAKKAALPSGETAAAKPAGFKPRFKATAAKQVTPKTQTNPEENNTKETATIDSSPDAPKKPMGFKPRFKPGVTSAGTGKKDVTDPITDPKEKSPEKENEQPAKPLGFKPRFKAGVTKPKKD